TGHSSMRNLRQIPLDILKIDRSFVAGLGESPEDTVIVESVIRLGHSFGLAVVAEGVETDAQRRHLERLGCDRGQGYLWSRPAPTDAVTDLAVPVVTVIPWRLRLPRCLRRHRRHVGAGAPVERLVHGQGEAERGAAARYGLAPH